MGGVGGCSRLTIRLLVLFISEVTGDEFGLAMLGGSNKVVKWLRF